MPQKYMIQSQYNTIQTQKNAQIQKGRTNGGKITASALSRHIEN